MMTFDPTVERDRRNGLAEVAQSTTRRLRRGGCSWAVESCLLFCGVQAGRTKCAGLREDDRERVDYCKPVFANDVDDGVGSVTVAALVEDRDAKFIERSTR